MSALVGFPKYFDLDKYLDAVESMVCADEIKFALVMLENLPGYHRDHYPERATKIKNNIYTQCMTVYEYVNDKKESKEETEEWYKADLDQHWRLPHFNPRGKAIMDTVNHLNSDGFCVNIVELGPFNYWLPVALQSEKCDFMYTPININPHHKCPVVTKVTSDKPTKHIFVCFEVIEHLWNEDEVFHYAAKTQLDYDFVFISTPKYTCGGGLPDWATRELGHIRTWTPKELTNYCYKHWPQLKWYFIDAPMMVCYGVKE